MERQFTFETEYNMEALTAFVKVTKKTVQKNIQLMVLGFEILVIAMQFFVYIMTKDKHYLYTILIFLILFFIFQTDKFSAKITKRRMISGAERNVTVFEEDNYSTTTSMDKNVAKYECLMLLTETKDYFVFFISKYQGYIYDKSNLTGGTLEEFRAFITEKTGKEIKYI